MLPPPNPFPPDLRRQLLLFARQTLEAAFLRLPSPQAPPAFSDMGGAGTFVSLHTQGRLRGCIGMVESNVALAETIAHCALGAAFEDRRFRPLELEELSKVAIEISLLSPIRQVSAMEVDPTCHGLLLRKERGSGLLLPQVAQRYRWSRERFLDETCRKAGLAPGAWKDPDMNIFVFTADVFSE